MKIGTQVTNPGEMNTSITLQSRTATHGTGGFITPSWANIATVWSRWRNLHGGEVWAAQAVEAEGAATVTIRYRTGIDETCSVLKGSERYEIVSIDDVHEHNEYIELKVRRMRTG